MSARFTRVSPQVQVVDPTGGKATAQFAGIFDDIERAIEALEVPLADIPDLSGTATLTDVIAAVNALFDALRDAGRMS